ncbi:MAG: hypothetical protein PHR89_03065 [Bacilli bacterium]|jgi:hypothetical protein|nr:hypothetical protein [Bacilli bacterium]
MDFKANNTDKNEDYTVKAQYKLSQNKDILLISSGNAFAKVKKNGKFYYLLKGSTINNTNLILSPKIQNRRTILLADGKIVPHPKDNSLYTLIGFEPAFDNLHEIVEIVTGDLCSPHDVSVMEQRLQDVKDNRIAHPTVKSNKTTTISPSSSKKHQSPIVEPVRMLKEQSNISNVSEDALLNIFKHEDAMLVEYKNAEAAIYFRHDMYILADKSTIISDNLSLSHNGMNFKEKLIKKQVLIQSTKNGVLEVKKQIRFVELAAVIEMITGEKYSLPYSSFASIPDDFSTKLH